MTDGIHIQLESHVAEIVAKMGDIAQKRMEEAVHEVRNTTLKTLSGQRTGRRYTIPGTHKQYTASSPGEPPAQRLGELRQSVSTLVVGRGDNLVGAVGTDKDYGPMLEFGTFGRGGIGRMHEFESEATGNMMPSFGIAARPWLRVSFEKAEEKVKAIFGRPWF